MPRRTPARGAVPRTIDHDDNSPDTFRDPLELIHEDPRLSGLVSLPQSVDYQETDAPFTAQKKKKLPSKPTVDNNALLRAVELIFGERASQYGDYYELCQRLSKLWAPILGLDVPAEKVALCLIMLKIAREIFAVNNGSFITDNIDDLAGYVGLYESIKYHAHQEV